MTSRVSRNLVGKLKVDSTSSSSIGDEDNSLDRRSSSYGNRGQSVDSPQAYHTSTLPKEKPGRRASTTGHITRSLMNNYSGLDPVRLELMRLENEIREKLCPSERCTKPIRVTLVRDLTQASSSGESMVTLRPVLKETMLVESLVCPE